MTGSFHISLLEGTINVDKIHVWFKIVNIAHALLVTVYQQTDFTPKSHLHDAVVRFRTPGWTHAGVTRAGMTFRSGSIKKNVVFRCERKRVFSLGIYKVVAYEKWSLWESYL